jgi:Family of unknown function (DUF6338)
LKIDISTVLLVILCIIPGLFAQKSRNLLCPRSFDPQGASAELGELVALGISTHGLLICFGAIVLFVSGVCLHLEPGYFFHKVDAWPVSEWSSSHPTEALSFATLYVFASFAASHALGVFYGFWRRQRSPITTALLRRSAWLKRRGITGVLGEQPIIYEALNPKTDANGTSYLVFIEVEMKNGAGFYSGQLSQFSIVKDEEPHKLIFIINAWFTKTLSEPYEEVPADGVVLDLSETIQLQIKQFAPPS